MRSFCSGNKGRGRGLAMVDTVVLLVVLVFLLGGVLMPMLSQARADATSDTCASHLASIGGAMLMYANDYNGALPRAAGRNSRWYAVVWNAPTRESAYRITGKDGTGGIATISSCFYLLVKYVELEPKVFLCADDPCMSEFTLAAEDPNVVGTMELPQLWDFGSKAQTHCSYAYHAPWNAYALTTRNEPNMAVAADRSPYLPAPGFPNTKLFCDPNNSDVCFRGKNGDSLSEKYGNSFVHWGEGQNVLFLDGHVNFETRPFCSREDDNIYTVSSDFARGDSRGWIPTYGSAGITPMNDRDSVLLNDPSTGYVARSR
jgi:prepilin-type processing-associated H-X9-DG protein